MDENDQEASDEPAQEFVTIPYALRGDEVVETKDVPKKWYEQTQRATRVADELAEEYQSHPDIARIAVTNSDQEIAGRHAFKVIIELADMDSAEEFPAKKDGVEVETKEAKRRHYTRNET